MEVVRNNYMPGDPRLIDRIVYELKSQGIFDNFRKECIADVDTKPAYQNLRQRVEGSVSGFLKTQRWRPEMNKNHVREMLRKNISESGFLETGVERIVDQVVNPKINSIFLPQVENVVYKFLGIQKPSAFDDLRNQVDLKPLDNSDRFDMSNNLLPSDLETVSPESETHDKKLDISNESRKLDDRMDEDESPPFEPLEESTTFMVQEENSIDSQMSGFSGLASHDSNHSLGLTNKIMPMEISNQDSQLSRQSSDGHLSIVISDETDIKIEMNEDSTLSKTSMFKATDSTSKSFDFLQDTQSSSDKSLQLPVKQTEDAKRDDKAKSDEKKSDRHRSSHKHKSRHDSRSESRDHKGDKDRKSDRDKKDCKEKSGHSSKDKKDKEKRDSKSKNGKDEDRDRSRNSSSKHSSSSSSKDKSSSKSEVKDSKIKEPESKIKSSSKEKTDSSKSRDDSKSKSRSDGKGKADSKSFSKHNGKSKPDLSDSSKSSSKSSKKDDRPHKKDEKPHSRSSSSKGDKKKDVKKDAKDDHYSLKGKKSSRRSTDRDSSDGHSGTHSSSSSFDLFLSSQQQKSSQDTSAANSGSSSGDSGNSDQVDSNVMTEIEVNVSANRDKVSTIHQLPHVKLIKPKFASNIFEARRLMKIRKKLGKIEKRTQMELMSSNSLASTENKNVPNHSLTYEIEPDNSDNSKRRPNILKKPSILKPTTKNHSVKDLDLNITTAQFYKDRSKPQNLNESDDETVAEVVEISDDSNPAPLRSAVISKESWDAVEAKLNLQSILKVDFNSYTDSSEDLKSVEEQVKPPAESQSVSSNSKDESFAGATLDELLEAQRRINVMQMSINHLVDDVARRAKPDLQKLGHHNNQVIYKSNAEDGISRRLPKVAIVDVTSDNEIVISPSKGTKRRADEYPDVHNNNKTSKELEVELLHSRLNHVSDKKSQPVKSIVAKVKKAKLIDSSVNQVDSFNLPLSPAESDKSFSTVGDKKNEKVDGKSKRNSTGTRALNNTRSQSNQRYSSDDLYKPRLQFSSTRRRVTRNSDVN